MRFNKIKYTKGKVMLEWEVPNKTGDYDQYTMSCSDEPKIEFRAALSALAEDLVAMCELPEEYITRVVMSGISLSYGGEKEVPGATLIGQMVLHNSNVPLNLISPHKIEEFYSEEGDPKQLLDDDCIDRIHELIKEAEAFCNGDRAQGQLFSESLKSGMAKDLRA